MFRIILLLCLVAPITTAYTVLKKQQKKVKREVKWKLIEGVDRNELVLLKFTEEEKRTQLDWTHSKEFAYKGEMYDIAETEVYGDTTYYWCWWDYEETALNKQLDQLFAIALGNSPSHKKNQEKMVQLFKSLYFIEDSIAVASVDFREAKNTTFYFWMNEPTGVSHTHSPPPQLN